MARFEVFKQNFSMAKKRLTLRAFQGNTDLLKANTPSYARNLETVIDNSALLLA